MEIERVKKHFHVMLFIPSNPIEDFQPIEGISVVRYTTYYSSKIKYLKNNLSFYNSLVNLIKESGRDTVICAESLIPAIKSYKVAKKYNCKFIFDCHGTEPDEFALIYGGLKGKILYHILALLQTKVINNTDLIVTVSNKQYDQLGIEQNHVLLPMMPSRRFIEQNNNRMKIRKKLGIQPVEEVFVYSGQNQKWQMCEQTIKIYKKISSIRQNTRLIIFTSKIDYFQNLVNREHIDNAIVISVPYDDMPSYLDACDYGFCIRNSSIINRVASPTNVLEYLSRNVKPILTEYVGDFSKDLPAKELAWIWNENNISRLTKEHDFDGRKYVVELDKIVNDKYIRMLRKL